MKRTIVWNVLMIMLAALWTSAPSASNASDAASATSHLDAPLKESMIPSDHGPIATLNTTATLCWEEGTGITNERSALVVMVPKAGLIWIGLPGSRMCLVGDSLVGIHPASGAIVVMRVSTNTLTVDSRSATALEAAATTYVRSFDGRFVGWDKADRELSLSDFVGIGPLMDVNKADGPGAPVISMVECKDSTVRLVMRSSLSKEIVLTLDSRLVPITASVDGKVVFERGKTQPPSLEKELHGLDQIPAQENK